MTILHPGKCHSLLVLLLVPQQDAVRNLLQFCGEDLQVSELETVLGLQIDNKLNFESHIKTLCSKASRKLGPLQQIF